MGFDEEMRKGVAVALLVLVALGAAVAVAFGAKSASAEGVPATPGSGSTQGTSPDLGDAAVMDPNQENLLAKARLLAQGITLAEGGDVEGSRPFRNNNPGDLEENGDLGKDSGGYGVFSSRAAGDQALVDQCLKILAGTSRIYRTDWTWAQVAEEYDKGGDALVNWLPNVISVCGMRPDQTVSDWLNS